MIAITEAPFKEGLRPTIRDKRNLKLGAIAKLAKLEDIPESFRFRTLGVKNQKNTDMCAAFAATLLSELQEDIELSPEWQFAAAAENPDEWGLELKQVLKSLVNKGSLPRNRAPFSLENKDADFLRRISNWPDLFSAALPQKKKSFWEVTGPYDHFDNIRAAMWTFKAEKRGVLSGLVWHWKLEDVVLDGVSSNGFGHAIAYIGFEKDHLVVQNSAGEAAGDRGLHYISRAAVNKYVEDYEAYMLLDISREEAERMLHHGIKVHDNAYVYAIKAFISVFLPFLKRWK